MRVGLLALGLTLVWVSLAAAQSSSARIEVSATVADIARLESVAAVEPLEAADASRGARGEIAIGPGWRVLPPRGAGIVVGVQAAQTPGGMLWVAGGPDLAAARGTACRTLPGAGGVCFPSPMPTVGSAGKRGERPRVRVTVAYTTN